MLCQVMPIEDFIPIWGDYAYGHLVRHNSDFQKKLERWLDGDRPTEEDGHIAVILDQGEVVSWARTETWLDAERLRWDTLEAFTHEDYRMRGLAAWAAAGLFSGPLYDEGGSVAVFRPPMLLVAKRAGFHPTLFEKEWVRCG